MFRAWNRRGAEHASEKWDRDAVRPRQLEKRRQVA
jgi:hypothetical protein